MNKGDLVNEVAKVVSTKKEAQAAVDCVFSTITKALKKKSTVTLVGPAGGDPVFGEMGEMQDSEVLMVKFSREDLIPFLIANQPNELLVGGALSGSDIIAVINKGGKE